MRALALALALASVGCLGRPLVKLPSGPGATAQDGAGALQQAIGSCVTIRTLTAEVAVSGSAGGRRIRARLTAGVSPPASARLEAVAPFGQPFFIFVATGNDATLLLPRDNRVLEHGRPEEVLEALTGVPLGAAALHDILTGCASEPAAGPPQARGFGDLWRLVEAGHDAELYLHRDASNTPWRLSTVLSRSIGGRSWRVDYGGFEKDLPRAVRLTSVGAAESAAFDLQLALSQVEINMALGADAFRVKIPESASPITLDDLRRSTPLPPKTDAR
jgi:outer membrane lipoprotein-sorting protein